jgi:hypothetical protein
MIPQNYFVLLHQLCFGPNLEQADYLPIESTLCGHTNSQWSSSIHVQNERELVRHFFRSFDDSREHLPLESRETNRIYAGSTVY